MKSMKKIDIFHKRIVKNEYALHAITIWKLKFLYKDIGNLKKKPKISKEIRILCRNICNLKKVTSKLLLPKFSAVMQ